MLIKIMNGEYLEAFKNKVNDGLKQHRRNNKNAHFSDFE